MFTKFPDSCLQSGLGPGSAAERPPAPSACVSAASSSGVDAAQASLDPAKAPSTRTGAGGGARTTPRFPRHREMRAFVSCMA